MEWTQNWRSETWSGLDQPWDLIIIGGGITGAGILREATQAGLKALLVEADDFASGSSSRSSKLVHGGLRYLKNAQLRMTHESVRERELLLRQGRGLINRLGFLYACLPGDAMPGWVFGAGLVVYDLMARQWTHRSYDDADLRELCPPLTIPGLRGGYRYFDANTDDARLVLRLLRESAALGGMALNYARVLSLLRTKDGQVCGVALKDVSGEAGCELELLARVVINATGVWADELRGEQKVRRRLRPLRGSHLIFPAARLPLTRAVSFLHPRDGRPVFALPWEGAVIFGTTDVDHKDRLQTDPAISEEETEYLLDALQFVFPAQELARADVIATFSGLRPVINTGKRDPSRESREHVIWNENGLLTVSGGKLTTFRVMARDALRAVRDRLGSLPFQAQAPILDPLSLEDQLQMADWGFTPAQQLRLLARYGPGAVGAFLAAPAEEREPIAGTPYIFAELRQAARAEAPVHLADLLLRRVRLGLLLARGGADLLPYIRSFIQTEMGWSDERWKSEARAYTDLWQCAYSLRGSELNHG